MVLLNLINKLNSLLIPEIKDTLDFTNKFEDKRIINITKNIAASFFIKGFGILLTFIQVPLLIKTLNTVNYGIWLTISSIVQWFWFFDIGLSNGLRNKFAEAIAENDKEKAKSYVSTAYFVLISITLLIIIIVTPLIFSLDWKYLLNAKNSIETELELVVFITFILFILRLAFQPISSLLLGYQKTALNDLINPLSNLLLIIFLLLSNFFNRNSLVISVFILGISPIIIYLIFSVYFFNRDFIEYKPNFKHVKTGYVKSLFNLSTLFFIIQVAGVVLYSTSNFLIINLVSPEAVTEFHIVYKYFSSSLMVYSLIVNPFWSSFTEAYILKDFYWIIKSIKKLKKIAYVFILIIFLMLILSDHFYKIWIGEKLKINFYLSFLVAIFFSITIYNMVYCYFLNGIGRLKEQAIMATLNALLHIPLSMFIVRNFGLGAEGIVLSLLIVSLPGLFMWPYLYRKEVKSVK